MKNLISFFLLTIIIAKTVSAQKTYTIDYTSLHRDNVICDGFRNPVFISGYTHQAIMGSPQKGLANWVTCFAGGCLALPADGLYDEGYIYTSAYKVPFNFKKNFRYDISGCVRELSHGHSGDAFLGFALSVTEPPTVTNCNASNLNSVRAQYSELEIPGGDCDDVADQVWLTPISTTITENKNYLLVAAFPKGPLKYGASALLYYIKIIETPPPFAMTGVDKFCSGQSSYSLSNTAPACSPSSITWSVSPANIATFVGSVNNPSCTLNAIGSGNVTLKATFTSCDQTPKTLTKIIHVGPYTSSDYTMTSATGSMYFCTNQSTSYSISPVNATNNYTWTPPVPNNPQTDPKWTFLTSGSGYVVYRTTPTPNPVTGNVSVSFNEPCLNNPITKSYFVAYSSSACSSPDSRYTYSPNPASTTLNVAVASGYIGTVFIRKIELIRVATGTSIYYQDYSSGNVTSTSITVAGFPSGNYTLRIYDGASWSSYTIMH